MVSNPLIFNPYLFNLAKSTLIFYYIFFKITYLLQIFLI